MNQQVLSFFNYLKNYHQNGLLDIIPAYCTVTIVFDLTESMYTKAEFFLKEWELNKGQQNYQQVNTVNIPVCYDFSLGLDLKEIALTLGISVEELIEIHCSTIYSIYMIGFLPGFPYMASVDERIRINRKSTPRTFVPKGSVGIAGEQTGIYPLDSPGGWQLIGQTPINIFDVSKEIPCLLQPGDAIQFNSISLSEFEEIKKENHL